MFYTIDRREGDFIILESDDYKKTEVLVSSFPDDFREGDVFRFEHDSWQFDEAETSRRRSEVKAKFNKIFKRG